MKVVSSPVSRMAAEAAGSMMTVSLAEGEGEVEEAVGIIGASGSTGGAVVSSEGDCTVVGDASD